MSSRAELAALLDQAPTGIGQLAAVAIGLFDRWELLDCIRVMRAAAEWARPLAWADRAEAWADGLARNMLAALASDPTT